MEAKILGLISPNPEVEIKQSDSKSFRRYLNEGFYVLKREDGFCKLRKAGILVQIEYNGKLRVIDLKQELFAYYGKKKIAEIICNFIADIKNESITIQKDSEGNWRLVKK